MVKANAYGLGVAEVSKSLHSVGCTDFFVATLEEAMELRLALPAPSVTIGVFQGLFKNEEAEYARLNITPVLNDIAQIERFTNYQQWGKSMKMLIHIDTGMTRLGLTAGDIKKISQKLQNNCRNITLLSHLACASTPSHPKNQEQLKRFSDLLSGFPDAKASLANSAGVFLGKNFHFDSARVGCALYGINPIEDSPSPLAEVVRLSAPILQIRQLEHDETVGYGATASRKTGARIAIIGIGYADGYHRLLGNYGNNACVYIAGHKAMLAGRVSMDMIAVDVSPIPENVINTATEAEIINKTQTVDDLAMQASTIGYEILSRLGRRITRTYHSS